MASDAAKFFMLTVVLAVCVLVADAGPCFSRTGEPAAVLHLAAGPGRHVIKAGETINVLALRYGVPAAAILKANPGLDPARMQLGKEIVIPAPGRAAKDAPTATVAPGPSGIELRPEKAPQATQPVAVMPKGHDLPDAISKAPSSPSLASDTDPVVSATPVNEPKASESGPRRPAIEDIWPMQSAAKAAGPSARITPAATGGGATWVWAVFIAVALIVGLALQGLLSGFAAGCALRVLRLFRVGDGVTLAGIVGQVETLGWFYVGIRSEAGQNVLVPNAKAISEIMILAAPRVGVKATAPRKRSVRQAREDATGEDG
jgi:LysM repeat protein